jgi:uncharacterized phage protein (TIGR01671 family)
MKKYRVWCKDNNEWEKHPVLLDTNGIIWHYQHVQIIPLKPENHIVCFFTELKDKNDKEIYEGDIVKATFIGNFIAPIIFDEGCFKFNTVSNGEHPYILLKDWCNQKHKLCEVIGNIYENPELLRENNE